MQRVRAISSVLNLLPAARTAFVNAYATSRAEVIVRQDFGEWVEGEVRNVKPGYMRHFLYPRKIAVYATEENRTKYVSGLTSEKMELISEKRQASATIKRLRGTKNIFLPAPASGNRLKARLSPKTFCDELLRLKNIKISPESVTFPKDIVSLGLNVAVIKVGKFDSIDLKFYVVNSNSDVIVQEKRIKAELKLASAALKAQRAAVDEAQAQKDAIDEQAAFANSPEDSAQATVVSSVSESSLEYDIGKLAKSSRRLKREAEAAAAASASTSADGENGEDAATTGAGEEEEDSKTAASTSAAKAGGKKGSKGKAAKK